MSTVRRSSRLAHLGRTVSKKAPIVRLVIQTNQKLHWIRSLATLDEAFLKNYRNEALLINRFALSDGTFVNMFALPDHASEVEPWYILNEIASTLNLDGKRKLLDVLDDDDDELGFEMLVHGPVLLVRIDEDNQELTMSLDDYRDLCDLYL